MSATTLPEASTVPEQSSLPITHVEHIVRTADTCGGKPRVKGTRLKVSHIAELINLGDSVDDLLVKHSRLTPASVHAALAYYYDHKTEIDAEIDSRNRFLEDFRLKLERERREREKPSDEGRAVPDEEGAG